MCNSDVISLEQLPVHSLLNPLRRAFGQHNQVILEAPTGAGKSTALPLAMLDWSEIKGKILMLEPRRVAARSVAHYIASQRGCAIGEEIGFRVRGESRSRATTKLEIVTEGILTRMIQQDPELEGIGLIIFDEIHERHLTTDLGLALALEIQGTFREDLKILAMSATLSGLPLHRVMPEAISLKSEGRSFPVDIAYNAASASKNRSQHQSHSHWIEHMGRSILDLLKNDNALVDDTSKGSLLAFLPGQGEIMRLHDFLASRLDLNQFSLCPLYGSLPAKAQDRAIAAADDGKRKIVLSTNVAESSLTIEGITMVVDSGYKRQASFNPRTGVTKLSLKRISQASAAQRSGRAGRLVPGHSLRLWSQEEQGRLLKADEPEILHTDLIPMVHDGACWGVKSLSELPLLTQPSKANESVAWQLLQMLDVVDERRKITTHGRQAYELGCHPRLAHMLLKAKSLSTKTGSNELAGLACLLAGVLESRSRSRHGTDIGNYLREAGQGESGQQVRLWMKKLKVTMPLSEIVAGAASSDIAFLLALAFPDRIAKSRGVSGYQLANGTGVILPDNDPLSHVDWLVVADFQESEGRTSGRVYLAAEIDSAAFKEQLSFLVSTKDYCGWDESKGRFFAETQRCIGQIVLSKTASKKPDPEQIKAAIIEQLLAKGLGLLNMDDKWLQLQNRVKLAAALDGEHGWPDFGNASLLASLNDWLSPYLNDVRSLSQLKALDCYTLLLNLLGWDRQRRLDTLFPCHWPMATGTKAKITYDDAGRALLSVRLQEALGMAQSPVLANGRLIVTMELLSPARRPLALTADLASFWQGPYVEVKKEMKGRYPKHLWPDDPANTLPTRFTKKKTLSAKS
ncbi:ATP-dependent helicase HrpB [Shewanella sediminis HAW-EB3]|uniref:ATP-dependent helicase HrpB n=1 Tax=Shewanella sediminis (strain HAW-EB3) TaxID=425104 RepID=A8G076_SHESH|nr:ATP-dependent helicase HrpB [Shewanella sediminis]ABV38499.1 ATP-dependent helicase HrpB [Shewanella sediminis HAW-EB3]